MPMSNLLYKRSNRLLFCSPGESIWIDLRFQNGSKWIWGDGSTDSSTWGSKYRVENRNEETGNVPSMFKLSIQNNYNYLI